MARYQGRAPTCDHLPVGLDAEGGDDLISCCIMGPYTCTESMALNDHMNICIICLNGPLFIAWGSPLLVPVCAWFLIAPLS